MINNPGHKESILKGSDIGSLRPLDVEAQQLDVEGEEAPKKHPRMSPLVPRSGM